MKWIFTGFCCSQCVLIKFPKGCPCSKCVPKDVPNSTSFFYPIYFSYIKTINLVGQREAPLCFHFGECRMFQKTPSPQKKNNNLWAHLLTTIFMVRTNVVWLSSSIQLSICIIDGYTHIRILNLCQFLK